MKRFLTAAILLIAAISALAQDYSTTWPYLYPTFTDGTIILRNGTKFQQPLNIHILRSALHYIDEGVVKEAQLVDVLTAQIGEDRYMNVEGRMMKVVAGDGDCFVAKLSLGDFERLLQGSGAYGTTATSDATRKLTSLEIAGQPNQNHMEMWESRHGGERVTLINKYYVVTPGKVYEANRHAVESALDDTQKSAFKQWIKNHKIKWNDPESLLTLTEFLNQ